MSIRDMLETLKWLTPHDVEGFSKVRIGNPNDGGYVMLDRFAPGSIVFSYGLSWNIVFEMDLACRGCTLFMFDHTISGLTLEHPNFNWHKEGLASSSEKEPDLFSLAEHVHRLAPNASGMTLKIDVEGAEWGALDGIDPDLLGRFDQIVLEMHDFARISDPVWAQRAARVLRGLSSKFTLHHVHANNCAPIVMADNRLPVADVIEASYVRTDLVRVSPLSTVLPGALDAANNPDHPDLPLWFFPYLPTGHAPGLMMELLRFSAHRSDG